MSKSKLLASVTGAGGLAGAAVLALGLGATPASAAALVHSNACPALTGGRNVTNCTVLITINPSSTVTTDPAGQPDYDGSDDAYVGIFNNTSATINHIFITGPAVPQHGGIFGGQDGDGICSLTFSGVDCTGVNRSAATNYAPNGVTFTVVTSNSGYVDFAGGILPGWLGYFSLEEPIAINDIHVGPIPEPVTLSLFGAGVIGAAALRRRKAKKA